MKKYSDARFLQLVVGDVVTVSVPEVDRGPLDWPNVRGIVLETKNNLYKVGTKTGIIKDWLPRKMIAVSNEKMVREDVPLTVVLSLRQVASRHSLSGGQGFKHCNCKELNKMCTTRRCACFKNNYICNSRCHKNISCTNKDK